MNLVIYNGSPRNRHSNTKILMEQFLVGYHTIISDEVPVFYLAERIDVEAKLQAFNEAKTIIIAFPLYTDSIPGIVKEFIEQVAEKGVSTPKKIGFIVQSGFPEPIQSTYVEKYLKKLTERLKCVYLGTLIKGGVEGIQIMSPKMTNKLFMKFQNLGIHFASHTEFDEMIKNEFSKKINNSWLRKLTFKILSMTGMANYYWDSIMKKNNVMGKSFDRPYESTEKEVT